MNNSTHPSHHGPPPGASLPDTVVVTRSYGQNHDPFTLTGVEAGKLYQDVKQLNKPVPKGPISCPSDNGLRYDLRFTSNGKTVLDAHASASGCEFVTYSNKGFWASKALWNDLGCDLNMSPSALHGYAIQGAPESKQKKIPFVPVKHATRIVVDKNGSIKTLTNASNIKMLVSKINQAGTMKKPQMQCQTMTKDDYTFIVYESGGGIRVFENHGGGCQGLIDDKSGQRLPIGQVLNDKDVM